MAAFVTTETQGAWSFDAQVGQDPHSGPLDPGNQIKKVEITIPPSAFEELRPSLLELSVSDVDVSEIRVFGHSASKRGCYRGLQYEALTPRIRIELLVHADRVNEIFTTLLDRLPATGDVVDTKVVISSLAAAVRISAVHRVPISL
jgi:nitrogen regulatory protein PII